PGTWQKLHFFVSNGAMVASYPAASEGQLGGRSLGHALLLPPAPPVPPPLHPVASSAPAGTASATRARTQTPCARRVSIRLILITTSGTRSQRSRRLRRAG